jgi:hypothetical protein
MPKLPGTARVIGNAKVVRNCWSYQGMPKLPGTAGVIRECQSCQGQQESGLYSRLIYESSFVFRLFHSECYENKISSCKNDIVDDSKKFCIVHLFRDYASVCYIFKCRICRGDTESSWALRKEDANPFIVIPWTFTPECDRRHFPQFKTFRIFALSIPSP